MANTQPIFPDVPNVSWGKVLTEDTSYETPTTEGVEVFEAGLNGSRIDQIKVRALGTNDATVLRLFVNDGAGTAAANFALIHEVLLPATTAAADDVTGDDFDINLVKDGGVTRSVPPIPYLPAGYKIYAAVGTTVASGYMVTVHGGDY